MNGHHCSEPSVGVKMPLEVGFSRFGAEFLATPLEIRVGGQEEIWLRPLLQLELFGPLIFG